MLANWRSVIEEVRGAAFSEGILVPKEYVADGRWHEADAGGAYLLFPDHPYIALLVPPSAHGDPIVWQPSDRLLTMALRARIADALAHCPAPVLLPRLEGASRFLAELLSRGPMATVQIELAAVQAGHAWATVRRAARALGVKSTRNGFGGNGRWV